MAVKAGQIFKDILFDTKIHDRNMVFTVAKRINFGSCYCSHLVMYLRCSQQLFYFLLRHICRHDNALQHTIITQFAGNRTCINTCQYRHILFIQKLFQSFFAAPVAGMIAQLTEYISLKKRFTPLIKKIVSTVISN